MPRTRNVLLLVIAAVALSTGGRWYREHAERKRHAVATATPQNARVRIPSVTYDRTPLRDVIADIQSRSGVSIRVNWEALHAAGVSPEAPVVARLSNITWVKALNVALGCVQVPGFGRRLFYDVQQDGSVVVTSERQGFPLACLEAYDQRELFAHIRRLTTSPENFARMEKEVEGLLVETVDPDSWARHGGPFGLCRARYGWVLVYQTPENHRHIQKLLEQLGETRHPLAADRENERLLSRLRGENRSPEPGVPR